MVCLETNFIVGMIRKQPDAENKFKEFVSRGEPLSTTTVTLAELYVGAYKSTTSALQEKFISDILKLIKLLPLDQDAAKKFGELSVTPKLIAQQVADLDLLIASIALSNGEAIVTNDPDFTRIPNVQVENW
jgi:tRNA(fMet)-specific endonuclease VapC